MVVCIPPQLSHVPGGPVVDGGAADHDAPVHRDGGDREGGDHHEDGLQQVQYCTLQYSTAQYSTVQCSTVQYLERVLQVAEQRGGAPVPALVHHLHLHSQAEVTAWVTVTRHQEE